MDSKNIKDYLHLYLGCNTDKGKLIGIELNKAICMMDDLSIVEGNIYNLKPILRPLSDMTEEELKQWVNQPSFTDHYCNKKLMEITHSIYGLYNFISFYGGVDSIPWLLSKGFDLFGLIDAGLAIKKSD